MVTVLLMQEQQERRRVTKMARLNVRPVDWEAMKFMADNERTSLATMIGNAIENYVTARST